LKKMQFHT